MIVYAALWLAAACIVAPFVVRFIGALDRNPQGLQHPTDTVAHRAGAGVHIHQHGMKS